MYADELPRFKMVVVVVVDSSLIICRDSLRRPTLKTSGCRKTKPLKGLKMCMC